MDERVEKFKNILKDKDLFDVLSIDVVNHRPHPYVVGVKLVTFVADHHGGMLTEAAIRAAETAGITCAEKNCQLRYHEHTFDKVLFLQLKQDIPHDIASDELKKLVETCEEYGIVGLVFVETAQAYRITSKDGKDV